MKELLKKITLTAKQNRSIEMVKTNKISIISGLPGSGKTTILKEILLWTESEQMHVTLASPTGRAAKRMVESTGFPAMTIHSTLGCTFDGYDFKFMHDEKSPLPTDFIIIDEMSMITNQLMSDLMKAVNLKRTKVLFVGDFNQLPSVGAGSVLHDLINTKLIPHVYLDEIHRNSGAIVEACAEIQAGNNIEIANTLDLESENPVNLVHIESKNSEKTLMDIKTIVASRMPARGYDPVWDVQIISPVNVRGELSCKSINEVMQEKLNPHGEPIGHFRMGDKVINTKNQGVVGLKKETVAIVNGDLGKIIDSDKKYIIVEFFEPSRKVKIPKGDNNLLLAYCITCHKFQGSESPVIIIPVNPSFAYMFGRSWIYTAISRAKDICITVGQEVSINRMVNNVRGSDRVTMLKNKIIERMGGDVREQ